MMEYINDGRQIRLAVRGKLDDLITDSLYLMHLVYQGLKEKDSTAAMIYREFFTDSENVRYGLDPNADDASNDEKKKMLDSLIKEIERRRKEGE